MSEFADSRKDLSSSTIQIIGAARKVPNLCFCIVMTISYGNLNKPAAVRPRASGVDPAKTSTPKIAIR